MSTAAAMFDENDFDDFLEGRVAPPVHPRAHIAPVILLQNRNRNLAGLVARVADGLASVSLGGWSWEITTVGSDVVVDATDADGNGAGSFAVTMDNGKVIVGAAIGQPRKTFARFVWDGANTPKAGFDPAKGDRLTHPVRSETTAVVVALRGVLS